MEIVHHRSQSRRSPRNASVPLLQSELASTRIIDGTHQHVCRESEAKRAIGGIHPTNKKLITLWQFVWLGSYCKVRKVLGLRDFGNVAGSLLLWKVGFANGTFFFLQVFSVEFFRPRLLEKATLITLALRFAGGCTNSPIQACPVKMKILDELTHSFIHPLIQQMLTEVLLCVRSQPNIRSQA